MTRPLPTESELLQRMASLRVWLVHDWLTGMRGGEKLLLDLVRLFPNSRIATLLHVPGATHPEIDARVQRVSFLQKFPNAPKAYRNYLPFFPRAARSLQLDGPSDLVLSVSHAVAKGIRVPPGVPHVCYCNTPMRYIWGMEDQYLKKASPKRLALALVKPMLRRFDRQNSSVSAFIGNSQNVADRIKRFYDRDAAVVYPGFDDAYFTPDPAIPREDFYFVVTGLVAYKRVDLAVLACLAEGRKLVVIGSGPELSKLQAMAAGCANIQFLGRQPDEVVLNYFRRCRAFLFPGEEDFGLTPVEAMATGAPVIAYRAGGVTETVVDTPSAPTGFFFETQSADSLRAALHTFETGATRFNPATLRERALHFTLRHFRLGVARVVANTLEGLPPLPHRGIVAVPRS